MVLDPEAPKVRGGAAARRDVLEAAASRDLAQVARQLASRDGGVLSLAEAARLARRPLDEVRSALQDYPALDADLVADPAALAATGAAYLARLGAAHAAAPTRAGVPAAGLRAALARTTSRDLLDQVERRLAAEGQIRVRGGQLALSRHDPLATLAPAALARLRALEAQVREGGAAPPDPAALAAPGSEDADLVELLVDLGALVRLRNHALRQTLTFHADAFDAALATLRTAFPPPTGFATGAARAALGTSRKFIVPILEFLDARGDTVREGDIRRIV
jgi:selenocysteine-specific elongation factor